MVGELLAEIMAAIGIQAFNFDLSETTKKLKDFLNREKYFVFIARDESGKPAGFIALYESYALYAEGAFGTIPELTFALSSAQSNWAFVLSLKQRVSAHPVVGAVWR